MGRAAVTIVGLLAIGGCGASGGAHGSAGLGGRGGTGEGTSGVGGGAGAGGTDASGSAGATAGAAGSAAGGAGGTGGAAGSATGGAGAAGASGCTFTVDASLSTAISTVGIVTFTTDATNMTAAEIRFGLASGGPTMTAPVDLAQPGHRTLLLGMKVSSTYSLRIVATTGAGTCTSADYTLTTGAAPSVVRLQAPMIDDPARHAHGFIVVSPLGGTSFIIDADGTPVWWTPVPRPEASRALISWDGRDVYLVPMNPGVVFRISMDGSDVDRNVSGLATANHDLTAIPGGVATILSTPRADGTVLNSIVERATDGTITMVVADLATLGPSSHTNSIHYYPWDDSYTIGDSVAASFVKITRKGELIWQFGGTNTIHPSALFQGVSPWNVNHGHHLLADGTFAFMNNGNGGAMPTARVFKLDTATMTATSVLAYQPSGENSMFLGDVQHLPNGNFLVTFRESGHIHEIDPSGQRIAQFVFGTTLGYSEFRESLYGPPSY
jgi:hypothetical protein